MILRQMIQKRAIKVWCRVKYGVAIKIWCRCRVDMYRVSAQGVDERMINVHYYYYLLLKS